MDEERGVYGGAFSIDPIYLFFLVNTMQIGVGILRAPRIMAEHVGNEGWISVLLGALLIQVIMLLVFHVLKRYQNRNLLEVGEILLGKPINYCTSVIIGLYYFLLGVLLIRDFIGILQDFIFTFTSPIYLFLLFLFPCYLLLRGGISLLTRFSVIVFFSTAWLLVFLIYVYINFQWEFMLPLFQHSISDYIRGTKEITLDYFGFEVAFFFYSLLARKENALLYASLGHWFSTAIYLAVIVGATGLYGSEMLKQQSYPVMDMFRIIQLPFVERVEIIGISVWGMLVIISSAGFILIGGMSIKHVWKQSFLCKPHILILLAFVTLLFLPSRFLDIDNILSFLGVFWLYVIITSTVLFVLLTYIKHGRRMRG
ncbi:GerAB/ArcD/ProY family transporter [Aneurinibacillus sp. REN35]|uniref:GerAB/ArcD/ProY family transporter n=1 Tax=Aneurinibacillus sp. REN35 TaxID=3237286 RepID=UPI003529C0D4